MIRAVRETVAESAPPEQRDALHEALDEIHAGWESARAHSEQLTLERDHYAAIFQGVPVACLSTDTDGVIGDVNRAAQQLLRYTPSQLVGRSMELFVTVEHRKAFRDNLDDFLGQDIKLARSWTGALAWGRMPAVAVQFTLGAISPTGAEASGQLCWVLRRA